MAGPRLTRCQLCFAGPPLLPGRGVDVLPADAAAGWRQTAYNWDTQARRHRHLAPSLERSRGLCLASAGLPHQFRLCLGRTLLFRPMVFRTTLTPVTSPPLFRQGVLQSRVINQPEQERIMSRINGDKSRFHRERKQKIARRIRNRKLMDLAEPHKGATPALASKPKPVSA
jgi:hypothetical protein